MYDPSSASCMSVVSCIECRTPQPEGQCRTFDEILSDAFEGSLATYCGRMP